MLNLILNKIRWEITFSAVTVSTLMALAIIIINYPSFKSKFEEFTFKELRAVGITLAEQIDMQAHTNLTNLKTGKDDINSQQNNLEYTAIHNVLKKSQKLNEIGFPFISH
jgi:hypothetical protein